MNVNCKQPEQISDRKQRFESSQQMQVLNATCAIPAAVNFLRAKGTSFLSRGDRREYICNDCCVEERENSGVLAGCRDSQLKAGSKSKCRRHRLQSFPRRSSARVNIGQRKATRLSTFPRRVGQPSFPTCCFFSEVLMAVFAAARGVTRIASLLRAIGTQQALKTL